MSDVEYVDITRDEESQGTLSLAVRWHGKHLLGAENASIPLIMIHGLSSVKEDWYDVDASIFKQSSRPILVFDNRGVGQSACPNGPYSIAMLAQDVITIMNHCKLAKVDLLGFSMGGCIAQTVAIELPERVRRLVLVGTSHGGREALIGEKFQSLLALIMQPNPMKKDKNAKRKEAAEVAKALFSLGATPKWLKDHAIEAELHLENYTKHARPVKGVQSQVVALSKFNSTKRLDVIRQRHSVLIVHGALDEIMPLHNARLLQQKLQPTAQLVVLEKVGHNIPLMAPELFASVVARFLTEPERSKL